jgi:hypothetical protein
MILYEQQQVWKYWVGDVEGGHKLFKCTNTASKVSAEPNFCRQYLILGACFVYSDKVQYVPSRRYSSILQPSFISLYY